MRDQMRLFCSWCGHFKRDMESGMDGQHTSPSWQAAYAGHAERRRAGRRQPTPPSA
jgi:hypothetical protein